MELGTRSLSERILQDLQNDPATKKADIDVSYSQNIVTLTGRVRSEAVRQAAEDIARRQPSVVTVINEIRVG